MDNLNDICDKTQNKKLCREGFTAALAVSGWLTFILWLVIYAPR